MKQQILPSGILSATKDGDAEAFPKTLDADGHEYTHLIGGIYLPVPMHELTLPQLQDVNRLRDRDFKAGLEEQKNDILKKLVASAIEDYAAGRDISVVDVGSGTTTIAPYFNKLARYVGVDIDPEVVSALRAKGVEGYEMGQLPSIKLDGEGVNAFVALYVLHFKIDGNFFNDIARQMKEGDVMFANLYRIADDRKQMLKEQAEKAGLHLAPEVADTKLSPGRQVFWTLSKTPGPAEKLSQHIQRGLGAKEPG